MEPQGATAAPSDGTAMRREDAPTLSTGHSVSDPAMEIDNESALRISTTVASIPTSHEEEDDDGERQALRLFQRPVLKKATGSKLLLVQHLHSTCCSPRRYACWYGAPAHSRSSSCIIFKHDRETQGFERCSP